MSLNEYSEQTRRICEKLVQAKKIDRDLKVFGASKHKYSLGSVVPLETIRKLEAKAGIKLPPPFVAFLTQVGNGSTIKWTAGAGPFYGIYDYKHWARDLVSKGYEHLKAEPVITPTMTDEDWEILAAQLEREDLSAEEYYVEQQKVYSGILFIGHQGCSSNHALAIVGPNSGKVINIDDEECCKPQFAFEDNFLDWYERWLDEIISGILRQDGPSWFGYTMGGSDSSLLSGFEDLTRKQDKLSRLEGLGRLPNATRQSCDKLLGIYSDSDPEIRNAAAKYLTKFDYERAKPILAFMIKGDQEECLVACQSIFWYHPDKADDWTTLLRDRLTTVDDLETLRFIAMIFEKSITECSAELIPFCKHQDHEIRRHACYTLREAKVSEPLIVTFEKCLGDEDPSVVHAALQALPKTNDKRVLDQLYEITQRFKVDEHYILTNLDHRLKERGFKDHIHFLDAYRNGTVDNIIRDARPGKGIGGTNIWAIVELYIKTLFGKL